MPKRASQRADAPFGRDDFPIASHTHELRSTRTQVNVDCVRALPDKRGVPEKQTTGAALNDLRARAGLTIRGLAREAGWAAASGVQRYLEDSYVKLLPTETAKRLADALEGKGDPAITRGDVMALAGFEPTANARPFQMEGASLERMREDVPIFGAALGAPEVVDGESVELTVLNSGDVVAYAKRPVLLNGRTDVYGLYVQGSSMAPRHEEGDTIYVDAKKTARIGEDIVLYLRAADSDDSDERAASVLIKRLVRTTANYVELEQFTPSIVFKIDRNRVIKTHRVIPWRELIG